MEPAKIDRFQLICLTLLFEMGTSLVLPFAVSLQNDAWIPMFIGCLGGIVLFLIHYRLFLYYPKELPTTYFMKIIGKYPGKLLGFIYILYFTYLSAMVLRGFGELLISFTYSKTPMVIINLMMIILAIYAIRHGIEVIARAGELYLIFIFFIGIIGFVMVIFSGLIDLNNLKPVLNHSWREIFREVGKQTLYVPYGELIAITYLLPYLNEVKRVPWLAGGTILLGGIILTATTIINIAVLTAGYFTTSNFPLLATIQLINIADFLERLDVFFLIAVFVGALFKITIFFYAAVIASTEWIRSKDHRILVYPFGIIIFTFSLLIANSYQEHITEGLNVVPKVLHIPLQVIIPLLLFSVAVWRNRKKNPHRG